MMKKENSQRLKGLRAVFTFGDGVVGVYSPRRHCLEIQQTISLMKELLKEAK